MEKAPTCDLRVARPKPRLVPGAIVRLVRPRPRPCGRSRCGISSRTMRGALPACLGARSQRGVAGILNRTGFPGNDVRNPFVDRFSSSSDRWANESGSILGLETVRVCKMPHGAMNRTRSRKSAG